MNDPSPNPSAAELARYLEDRGEISKPWMLHLLRLVKLKEAKSEMTWDEYLASIKDAHEDLMRLGEYWKGHENELFNSEQPSTEIIEPLPGSPEDR